ncbi:MAG: histidine kinase dimerization/phosphoacceptor domain -containing protein [Putridiphycobacter sp.]
MSPSDYEKEIQQLKKRISFLENQVKEGLIPKEEKTVNTPPNFKAIFDVAEGLVGNYFSKLQMEPSKGSISIDGERYVLMRASSLSFDFLNKIKDLYADKGEKEAIRIGQNFLFDISHVIGLEDAKVFHQKMNLKDPISKLSAGPVHFAYSGWAFVDIIDSNPTPDENYYLKYNHPYSFEAQSWLVKGIKSTVPVCTMNSGYSSGWCEESFGIPLTTVEISCKAKGDDTCTFIMAPPHKIQGYLDKENIDSDTKVDYEIPLFFERKKAEQVLLKSLEEKSILLKEVHHRVKNNLQIITSLLNLQSRFLQDSETELMFRETKNRIKAIALVHEKLYNAKDVQHVNLTEYIRSIIDLLNDSFDFEHPIQYSAKEISSNKLKIEKAMPIGLMVNELVSNSIKHAFDPGQSGEVLVNLDQIKKGFVITVQDNGKGLPPNFDPNKSNSLGFEIIQSLLDQLSGTIEFGNNKGASFTLKIPV